MSENLIDIYKTELTSSKSPSKTLRRFYWELLELEGSRSDIIMINKLLRLYGKWRVFYAIIEIYGMKNPVLAGNTYGLFKTIIENKLKEERLPQTASDVDLTSLARKRKKLLEELKETLDKLDLPESYREDE